MTRARERFKVFEFNEAEERVHCSSMKRLRKFDDPAKKLKMKMKMTKKKFSTTTSPSAKYKLLQFFSTCGQKKENCTEPIYVDSEDGLDSETTWKKRCKEAIDLDAKVSSDTRASEKEFGNEAIDLDAEDTCSSKTLQEKICTESVDVDSEVVKGAPFAEDSLSKGLSDADACCQVGMALEDSDARDHSCPDRLVCKYPIAGRNSITVNSPNYHTVPVATISDDDDDESTEMSSSTDMSTVKQNEVLRGRVPEHGFGDHCHTFYPKGARDAVSIGQREMELLQPERFINDNIIDFYINYLKNKMEPDKRQRFHFFNCFFFRKIADLDREPFSACESRAAFERVRTWTKDVNLFEKDYIFIPVNFKSHWSLVVVCHPGEVVSFEDVEVEVSPKVPCILHMDSIKGSHRGLENLFQSYLCELWKEKHGPIGEEVSSKILHLRFIQLELPQQENWYDCGIFLLHYVELFLKEAPINFNPSVKAKFSNFLGKNWFPPAEASQKRAAIRELINGIFENGSQEFSPADGSDEYSSFQVPYINFQDTGVEIVEEICNSTKRCHVSTPRTVKCRESGQVYSGMFEPEFNSRSLLDDKYTAAVSRRSIMPSIEELEEEDTVSVSSINGDKKSSGAEEVADSLLQELNELDHIEETKKHESPSTSCEEFPVYVEDSEDEANEVQDGRDSPYQEEMLWLKPMRG